MADSPDGIYEKGVVDPGFPVKNSTQPFWLTEPCKISKLQSPWPEKTVDIAVVGSGMTAASLVNSLYSKQPNLEITILEARDLCSGATGRNGGHIKAMSPGSWFERKEKFGIQEAVRIMEYEHSHLKEMAACIRDNNIHCDLDEVEGLDVYYDEKVFRRACDAVDDMRQQAPALGAIYNIYTAREELKERNISPACFGAIGMPAASMWPYKMVTSLLEKMVQQQGLSIQTNTLVTAVYDDDNKDFAVVRTDRGDIRAKHVVHATNAWVSRLIPELRQFVSPVRANVQRQVPQMHESEKSKRRFRNSWWSRYGEHDYEYMVQRPDGAYVLGRASTGRRATADDSTMDFLAHAHLQGVTPRVFEFGAKDVKVTHSWSGSVAFTIDGNPFVGRLPFAGRQHQWICAAYSGIGMVRAFKSGQLLALMLLGEEKTSYCIMFAVEDDPSNKNNY
ncbi:FAD dependent oxidoreductase [Dactylonectria macrodidyma]|uniref:FAD dependent oxidoreductase n=1 Tax=Dactylonectria macrodidyma TaxID=307937 RepID=A0A9P9FX24_9HYPO|nr:FAD dependent oxidoreductase [Dactylonectria macrodidyma]